MTRENPGVTEKPCPFCGDETITDFPSHSDDCPNL